MLEGKVVVVTGAGTGIGAAVAKVAATAGARVVLNGRRREPLENVATSIDGGALIVEGDAGRTTDMAKVVGRVTSEFGGIDALIACAGTVEVGAAGDTDDASWERVLHSNLQTAFVSARATLPALVQRKGSVVVVSSLGGLEAVPKCCGYVVAKHAVIGLIRSIAVDYGPYGVRANAVCPGWVRTPMGDAEMSTVMAREKLSLEEAYAFVSADTPLRRAAMPREIADLCCFLASERSAFVTGTAIVADGGSTAVSVPMLRA